MSEANIKQQLVMNTEHFAIDVQEKDAGVSICVFYRHGDLIEEFYYKNEEA